MKKLGNKGFTLIEMAIAFSILAVVMLTVTLIITTSSNTYNMVATDISLQYESQTAMSQIQEYIIDCNAYMTVSWDNSVLYIYTKTDDTHYQAYMFAKKADTDELYFYKKTIETDNLSNDSSKFTFADDTGQLMSSHVTSFSAAVSSASVSVTINYKSGKKTYSGQQTIAFRNPVNPIY
jgi:prepilin-type N-terminal cleavage/methylation domain-containing protein